MIISNIILYGADSAGIVAQGRHLAGMGAHAHLLASSCPKLLSFCEYQRRKWSQICHLGPKFNKISPLEISDRSPSFFWICLSPKRGRIHRYIGTRRHFSYVTWWAADERQLVVELAQQRRATLDPVLYGFVSVEQNGQHEVGRVSGCRQHASTFARLVHWTLVPALHNASNQPQLQHAIHKSAPKTNATLSGIDYSHCFYFRPKPVAEKITEPSSTSIHGASFWCSFQYSVSSAFLQDRPDNQQ